MNKQKLIITIGAMLLIVVSICSYIFMHGITKFSNVNSISIIAKDENLNVVISDMNDIKEFKRLLGKYPVSDSPSCPFGYVEIKLNQENSSRIFLPATDGCHIIKTNDKFIRLSDNEWRCLIQILQEYNIDHLLLERNKGI